VAVVVGVVGTVPPEPLHEVGVGEPLGKHLRGGSGVPWPGFAMNGRPKAILAAQRSAPGIVSGPNLANEGGDGGMFWDQNPLIGGSEGRLEDLLLRGNYIMAEDIT